jgi:hypothetical protein
MDSQRRGGWLHGPSNQPDKLVDRGRRLVCDVDDAPVRRAGQRQLHGGGDVAMMNQAHSLGGMHFEVGDQSRQLFQMPVLVAIDEAEPLNGPGQPAGSRLHAEDPGENQI